MQIKTSISLLIFCLYDLAIIDHFVSIITDVSKS